VGLNSYDNQLELKYSDASLGQIKAYTIDIIGYLGIVIATNNCYPARETACVAIGEEKCSRWYCLWWVWLLILIAIILLALCFFWCCGWFCAWLRRKPEEKPAEKEVVAPVPPTSVPVIERIHYIHEVPNVEMQAVK
jgi:hypothetical protein